MKLALLSSAALAALFVGITELRVTTNPQNVVASRLLGQWVVDHEITERLGGRAHRAITFENDPSVLEDVPEEYDEFLGEKPIFLAGKMYLDSGSHAFLLLEYNGNPTVIWFQERDGKPFGDSESFNLMLAPAEDTENDLLLIGGDFNNQPFAGYQRHRRARHEESAHERGR